MKGEYLVLTDFVAKTPAGDKQIRAGQIIRLPEESALQLLEMGKVKEAENRTEESKAVKNKSELISQETLNAIFTEATNKLEDLYQGGEYEHARIHHPELYQAERAALSQVDALWIEILAGKVSLDVFRQAINKWGESVMTLIEEGINTDKKK